MKAVEYIEIDVPVCVRTYGVSPCTATGATGAECYNSLKTCQDTAHYSKTTQEVRFGYPDADDKSGIDHIPSLKSISFRPQQVSLGEGLGVRASLSVAIEDHRDADVGPARDPYWQTRGIDAYATGTFWGKFRARHAYMVGAMVRYVQGYEGQQREEMEARTFVIEKISGPSLDGKVTITAKDVLKLADDDKAQCPRISTGRLSADLTTSATSCTMLPSGVGNSEYPSSGYVTIGGKEVCAFTRSGDTLTITRAQFSTTADSHKQGDIVQICKAFFDSGGNGLDPADIVYDLMVNYSAISSSWITIGDWREKTDKYLNGRRYYTLIAEPTSVRDLLNELISQAGIILWSDDVKQQIRMDMVRYFPVTDLLLDESNTIAGSFDIKDQPDKRLSQVWVYYGQRNPLEKLDESTNFSAAVAVIDDEMEDAHGIPAIRKIYSRWIPRSNRPAASDVCYYLLSRFRSAPREVSLSAWKDNPSLLLAGRYDVTAWPLQSASGAQTSTSIQVTELQPSGGEVEITAQEIAWHVYAEQPDQGLLVVFDNDCVNVDLRAEYNRAYTTPESGDTVTFLVESGVRIGSDSVDLFSMTVGTWPAGVTVKLINRGYIVGKGGNGANGVRYNSDGRDGQHGGSAMYTRTGIQITNEGIIGGGGGGGGGGAAREVNGNGSGSAGGGGGAGYVAGSGGVRTQDDIDGHECTSGKSGLLLTGGDGGYGGQKVSGGGGGRGGDIGEAGSDGVGRGSYDGGSGGAAGSAVDGDSYITWTTLGDIRGSRIN